MYANLEELAGKYNAALRGWWNYYGSFYKTEMRKLFDYLNQRLALWARRKYKKFRGHKRMSFEWLGHVMEKQPMLFHHWQVCRNNGWITGAVDARVSRTVLGEAGGEIPLLTCFLILPAPLSTLSKQKLAVDC